jgi:hypothetical protein
MGGIAGLPLGARASRPRPPATTARARRPHSQAAAVKDRASNVTSPTSEMRPAGWVGAPVRRHSRSMSRRQGGRRDGEHQEILSHRSGHHRRACIHSRCMARLTITPEATAGRKTPNFSCGTSVQGMFPTHHVDSQHHACVTAKENWAVAGRIRPMGPGIVSGSELKDAISNKGGSSEEHFVWAVLHELQDAAGASMLWVEAPADVAQPVAEYAPWSTAIAVGSGGVSPSNLEVINAGNRTSVWFWTATESDTAVVAWLNSVADRRVAVSGPPSTSASLKRIAQEANRAQRTD